MSCMCGDTACWSCGPAQGFDPGYEREFEKLFVELYDTVVAPMTAGHERNDDSVALAEDLLNEIVTRIMAEKLKAQDEFTRGVLAARDVIKVDYPDAANMIDGWNDH